jgi:sensor histidine kinase YesM
MSLLIQLNKTQIQRHFIIWVIIIVYLNLDSPVPGSWTAKIIGGPLESFNYMFVFYSLSLFIFPKFWESNRYYLFVCIVLCIVLYLTFGYLIVIKIFPYLGGISIFQSQSIYFFLIKKLYNFFVIFLAGIGYYFYQLSIYKIKLQVEKENSILVKELNFLKNQFNSHITFNFLNYCYSKIHRQLPETAESIELFSDMLRHALQTKLDSKIPISNEVISIENFLKMQKLLNANICATFHYEGDTANNYILSNTLTAFLEDAFKYGDCNDRQSPLSLNLIVGDNNLDFTIINKIKLSENHENIHSGLENLTQILDLYYANNYHLVKEERSGLSVIKLHLRGIIK